LRGAVPHTFALYAATIVMGAGIAIMQPALPPLVRQWLPKRVSFATALYTNGLLVGETLAVMLTIPVVLPLADNSWRWALAYLGHATDRDRAHDRASRTGWDRREQDTGVHERVARLEQPADLEGQLHLRRC
jgi:hypothetical protein